MCLARCPGAGAVLERPEAVYYRVVTSLDEALRKFDTVEANLVKAEKLWKRIEAAIPDGIAFMGGGPEGRAYDDLCRTFDDVVSGLPAIDGWRIKSRPADLDAIGQWRFDAQEVAEPEALVAAERHIFEPGDDLQTYRYKFRKKRRELVRARLRELIGSVDSVLQSLLRKHPSRDDGGSVEGTDWDALTASIGEIDRLQGGDTPHGGRWDDLYRHLYFPGLTDLHDIAKEDWPAVRKDIEAGFFDETEPLPVDVEDLGTLVLEKPAGPVSTGLEWDVLSDERFERLLFCLISDAAGYENPQWLTKTRAPDRGRDLSVDRVHHDELGGTKRRRVIIQCKHWLTKSVAADEVAAACAQMDHWEPPTVDVLVIATSGRFTSDGVDWVEKHNNAGKHPEVEMWPESHLERLLAKRPHLVAEFRLR
jgi:hypothetical protein